MVAHKTDSDRRRRNAPTFEWTWLPHEGRTGRAPAMPPVPPMWDRGQHRGWSAATKAWWSWVWKTPQATQWDESGQSLYVACSLREAQHRDPLRAHTISAELRQIEDRHGLNPKAMLALRWKVLDAAPTTGRPPVPSGGAVLGLVDPSVVMPPRAGKGSGVKQWRAWAVACGADPAAIAGWDRARLIAEFGSGPRDDGPPPSAKASPLDRIKRR